MASACRILPCMARALPLLVQLVLMQLVMCFFCFLFFVSRGHSRHRQKGKGGMWPHGPA